MKCVVKNCENDRKNKDCKKTFFLFPREKTQLKKWLKFCNNKETFKPKTWRICIDHFNDEDICGNGMYNMGYAVRRTLKPGAVPCRYNLESVNNTGRDERADRRENKKIVASLLMNADHSEDVPMESTYRENTEFIKIEVPSEIDAEQIINENSAENSFAIAWHEQEDKIKMLEEEVKQLKMENENLKNDLWRTKREHEYEISVLKEKITKSQFHYKNIEERLKRIFTVGQINKLKTEQEIKIELKPSTQRIQ